MLANLIPNQFYALLISPFSDLHVAICVKVLINNPREVGVPNLLRQVDLNFEHSLHY